MRKAGLAIFLSLLLVSVVYFSIRSRKLGTIESLASTQCDKRLWDAVYNPRRLKIQNPCIAVTGTIVHKRSEEDGDYHIEVRLDEAYAFLLNDRNLKHSHGNLVVETICAHPSQHKDVPALCNHPHPKVDVPRKGTHVRIVGSYVLDNLHKWMEIHPATSISPLP